MRTTWSSLPSHLGLPRPAPGAALSTWTTSGETGWPSDLVQFCSRTCTGQSASAPRTCWGTSWSGRCCSCCSPAAPRSGTRPSLVSVGGKKGQRRKGWIFWMDPRYTQAKKHLVYGCSDCKSKHGTCNNHQSVWWYKFVVFFTFLPIIMFSTWFLDKINRELICVVFYAFNCLFFLFRSYLNDFVKLNLLEVQKKR